MSRGAKTSSLRIQWVRSAIGFSSQQGKVIQGLGFRRLRQVVERPDTPQIRGMIIKVGHLVKVVPPATANPFAAVPEYTVLPRAKARAKPAAKVAEKEAHPAPKKAPAEKIAPVKKVAAAPAEKPKKAEAPKRAAKPARKAAASAEKPKKRPKATEKKKKR